MIKSIDLAATLTICIIVVSATAIACADAKPEIFVQMGHTGNVTCAVFSPDGKYLLSGSVDNTMKLWDVATGRELRTFSGPMRRITSIAVSLDGKYAVSGDEDYKDNLKLWDISTGKRVRTFGGHGGHEGTICVAFSPDGKYIFSGGDTTIKLWDIVSGIELRTFRGKSARVRAIVVSPDGRYVISGSSDNNVTMVDSLNADGSLFESRQVYATSKGNTILVWDIASGRLVRGFNNAAGWVNSLAISPDGKYVFSSDFETSVKMWELASGRHIKSFETNGTSSIAISPDGKYALFGGVMAITLWNISAGVEIQRIEGLKGWVSSVAFSPEGTYAQALTADESKTPRLWDLASGKTITSFGGSTQKVTSVVISNDGKRLFIGQSYGNIHMWDIPSGRQIGTIKNTLGIECMAIDEAGTFIGAGGYDFSTRSTTAKFWNVETGKEISTMKFKGERGYWSKSLTIGADQTRALWTAGSTLLLSDVSTGNQIRTYNGHEAEIMYAAMSSDGRYAVTKDVLRTNIWDIETGEIVKSYVDEYAALRVCSNGSSVLIVYPKTSLPSRLTIWDFQSKTETVSRALDGDMGARGRTALSPDGKYAIAEDRWTLSIWDITKGRELRSFSGHTNSITSLGMSPNQKYLYSGSEDGTTRFWDISTGKEIARFVSFTNGEWVVITPEGYFNASSNGAKYLNVRVGNNVYSIDNLYEKFYNPVYVASALQGSKVETVADIQKGILTPPEVKIISPRAAREFNTDTVTIAVSAKDMGGGIDEIRLYQNDKAIGGDTRGMKVIPKGNEVIRTYTITLVDGANTFRAIGFSKDRTESNPCELTLRLAAPQKMVSMHILAVGINTYKNPALNLNYAEPDAKGIVQFFKQEGGGLFKNIRTTELYSEQATKQSIISQLGQLQDANPQDVVLIYLAGHGENINEKWYFIPYELTYPEREADVMTKAISSDDLRESINKIRAQKILVLIDACKSGAVLVAFRGFEDRKALSQLSRSTGVHIVAASTKSQFAAEVGELGHGVFTYTLLGGLGGKAAGKGETITVRKLMSYIEEQLPELTKKYKQEAQYPVVDSRGMDFPLVKGKD